MGIYFYDIILQCHHHSILLRSTSQKGHAETKHNPITKHVVANTQVPLTCKEVPSIQGTQESVNARNGFRTRTFHSDGDSISFSGAKTC
jgi:hypothetical protein